VCVDGCDFATIQAAIDDDGTAAGAIIEVRDAVHTEAGIVVNKDVTIRGLGVDATIVQAHETLNGAPERVLIIDEDATVTLEKVNIRHGKPSRDECGGGILNQGVLMIIDCIVSDNSANGGGGLCSRGSKSELTIINSTIRSNISQRAASGDFACGSGGGIKSGSGTLVLINSTVTENYAASDRGRGGGIHVGCNCTAEFANSTISGNRAVGEGGGIDAHGTLQLTNCTVSDNHAGSEGGGIYVRGRLDYVNTIVANNTGKSGNCAVAESYYKGGDFRPGGSLGTNSNNLVGDGSCDAAFSGDPMLGPLADNGGPTLTHALLSDSPAIDAISAISCTVSTDQREVIRPVAQTSSDTPCDIGAFEMDTASL
jgi:hypothetical protein